MSKNPAFAKRTQVRVSATFTRPADTTAYASGDLVANSTTAGSVVPMSFTALPSLNYGGRVKAAKVAFSDTVLTNASFRLHLYNASPVPTNGDNAAWLTSLVANYLGFVDVTVDKAMSDGAAGRAAAIASTGDGLNFQSTTLYALLEARAAYTPTSAEVFVVTLEIEQN